MFTSVKGDFQEKAAEQSHGSRAPLNSSIVEGTSLAMAPWPVVLEPVHFIQNCAHAGECYISLQFVQVPTFLRAEILYRGGTVLE